MTFFQIVSVLQMIRIFAVLPSGQAEALNCFVIFVHYSLNASSVNSVCIYFVLGSNTLA